MVELGSQDGRKYTLELRAELAVGLAVCGVNGCGSDGSLRVGSVWNQFRWYRLIVVLCSRTAFLLHSTWRDRNDPYSLFSGEQIPVEMHKTKILQKLTLIPTQERLAAIAAAGYNTFLLQNAQVFLDMLTDSGTNAMSDQQLAAMMVADDSYAGSQTFTRLERCAGRSLKRNSSFRAPRQSMRAPFGPSISEARPACAHELPLHYNKRISCGWGHSG